MKLNKGEKRALKFAMQQGLDVENAGDLKEFLAARMKDSKKQSQKVMAVNEKYTKKPQFNS